MRIKKIINQGRHDGLMASVLDSADQAAQWLALAGVIVLCSWARHFTMYSVSASLHPGV